MKRDFLLGGTKLPTGGAVRGAGGAMSPPVFMLKEALMPGPRAKKECKCPGGGGGWAMLELTDALDTEYFYSFVIITIVVVS